MSEGPTVSGSAAASRATAPRLQPWALLACWTLLMAGFAGWSAYNSYHAQLNTAAAVARDIFNRDLVYRRWVAKKGGVYAPISAETPPNPRLSGVPERDITTPSGRQLTLINPAYMTRQVHELGAKQAGPKAHITSLNPIRPENAADAWETAALRRFGAGATEVAAMEQVDGAPYLRYMAPLLTEEACLGCHASQGYRVGDVRGGISVSVPWAPYRDILAGRIRFDSAVFAAFWALGVAGIVFWRRRLAQYLLERTTADRVLQAERDRAQQYLDVAGTILISVARDQSITLINKKGSELLGYPQAELVGKNWFDVALPEPARDDAKALFARQFVAAPDALGYREGLVRTRAGASLLIGWDTVPVRDADGAVVGVLSSGQDITERTRAEEALRQRDASLRESQLIAGLGSYVLQMATGRWESSDVLDAIFGLDAAYERTVAGWTALIHPDDRDAMGEYFAADVLGRGRAFDREYRIVRRCDGAVRWVHGLGKLEFGADGQVVGMHGTIQDITARKRTEQALHESEARYRRITEGLTDYQYTVRVENGRGVETTQSPACELVTGYAPEEFAAEPYLWIRMVAPEDRDQVADRVQAILAGKDIPPIEHRIVRKDGRTRWVRDTTILFRDAAGRLLSYDGVITDITERREAEAALRASEEKYRALFEESRDVIYISTAEGAFVDINPAGVALLGYPSKAALMAVSLPELYLHREDRTRLLGLLDTRDFVEDFKSVLVRLDGLPVHVSITAAAIRDVAGGMVTIRGIIRDITENQRLENQLRQSQKMESIGTLAGGVAHDFNNILTAITGYGHMALLKLSQEDPCRRHVAHILEAAQRATHLTGDLLLFSRKNPVNRRPVDLNEGLRKLNAFLVRVIGEDIAFTAHLCAEAIPILADEHQISQVLMNLAANARDAMPGGGVFTIRTERVLLDDQFAAAHQLGAPGLYGLITVSDTGSGMDEQTRLRIFEPFFTTKEPGKGTGLGMAVVYGIVSQHDGLVSVSSEPGCGTTFRIYLPVVPGAAGVQSAAAPELPEGGSETILLAEDDAAVREMTLVLLREYGYRVIAAVDGADAVEKFREHRGRVQLLLFDLIMPRKSGKEAYDEISALQPGVKVIFSSGYDPDMVRQRSITELGLPMINKPVEMPALLNLIRAVLGGSGRGSA
jgi:PAS domain S-box-containing protein